MRLFAPDLYRNLAFGFVLGAVAVGAATSDEWDAQAANPAQMSSEIEPSAEFLIGE